MEHFEALNLYFTTQSRVLMTPWDMSFENIVGKGENAGNQHFLFFPQCFYPSLHKFKFFIHINFIVCKMLSG